MKFRIYTTLGGNKFYFQDDKGVPFEYSAEQRDIMVWNNARTGILCNTERVD
jgi:hypothetical protein